MGNWRGLGRRMNEVNEWLSAYTSEVRGTCSIDRRLKTGLSGLNLRLDRVRCRVCDWWRHFSCGSLLKGRKQEGIDTYR